VRTRGRVAAPHLTQPAPRDQRETIGLDEAGSTPILREYRAVKERFPDAVVLARLGDFYEMFGADAETAAPILGVALTGRSFGHSGRLNMCGVPHHAATGYIRRLLDAGLRVALWDQVGTPGEDGAGKLVRREITRVLSPGMVLDDEYLQPGTAVRCVALHAMPGRVGVAAFDASTGELQMGEIAGGLDSPALAEECERLGAAELLLPEGVEAPATLAPGAARTTLPAGLFDSSRGAERLRDVTGTASLRGLGVDALVASQGAAGAIVAYCERSRVVLAPGFLRVRERRSTEVMRLDAPTRRNLELLAPMGGTGPSLVQLLDRTRTPMGARLLRARLQEPLVHPAAIDARLGSVALLAEARAVRDDLREALSRVRDLERLVGRCVQGLASPRDLGAVRAACEALPDCAAAVAELAPGTPQTAANSQTDAASSHAVDAPAVELHTAAAQCGRCDAAQDIAAHLRRVLVDEPPATARDGGAIRKGADAELDSMDAMSKDARTFIDGLEARERERTGIRSLKVGYNRVFGYYIEVPNAHAGSVPADYVRKQTLVGCERYITSQLKQQETVVLNARERALAREAELLRACAALVAEHAEALLGAAAAIAILDVAQALACVADEEGWVRPSVDDSVVLDVHAGRHPLVERSLRAGEFVPNDTMLDADDAQLVILTGPNMAGKSTYLRQTALIVLLAQVGSFVPAARARVGVCDRIFTRVGAQDDLAAGLSTFMVEMAETAAILNAATRRSLVILDEIGRGTSTYDGLSIAQAVVEHLHDAPHLRCRTLFATHYHELTALAERLPRARNARVEVVEEGDHVTFLHRIVPGGADRSYGIHVARLAGVPGSVLLRARQLLADLEAQRPLGPLPAMADQLALPLTGPALHPVVEELQQLDLDGLSPLAALNKLAEWRERIAR
jgi:DNA mismatch repair protein MutS